MINLKRLKEHAKQKNNWMANFLGIDKPAYSRLESKPESLSLEQYLKLKAHFGDLDEYMNSAADSLYKVFDNIDSEKRSNPYDSLFTQRDLFLKVLKEGLDNPLDETPRYLQWPQIKAVISANARLPNIGVFGRSDVGKSHLLNTLLGDDVLPAKFTPTTSITIQVVHEKYRPSWVSEKVALMKQDYWKPAENGEQAHIYWSTDSVFTDEKQLRAHWDANCLYRGGHDVLSEFAVRPRFNLPEKKKQDIALIQCEAHTAIVFVDAPILEYCQLVDIPGFENVTPAISDKDSVTDINSKRESEAAINSLSAIDMAIFLSPLIGSFNSNDRGMLSLIKRHFDSRHKEKRSISDIDEIIWVISQADPSRSNQAIDEAKEQIAGSLVYHFAGTRINDLSESAFKSEQLKLNNKLNVFWSDTNDRRQPLLEYIEQQLTCNQPKLIRQRTRDTIQWFSKLGEGYYQKKVFRWNRLIQDQKLASITLQKENVIKEKRIAKINASVEKVKTRTIEIRTNSISNIESEMSEYLTVDSLELRIKAAYQNDNKAAKENAFGLIYEQLQSLVDQEVERFSPEIDQLFRELEYSEAELSVDNIEINIDQAEQDIPRDIKGIAAAGTSSIISAGAMTIVAGSMGNLGGYALAAKGVGFLSSLGLSFAGTGGTAGVMSGIAAIGGPVTLGALITGGIGLTAWRLLGDKWERRLANKLIKLCTESDLSHQFIDSTQQAFELLLKELESQHVFLLSQYESYLNELRELIDGSLTVSELERLAKVCSEKRNFFRNISFECDV